MSSGSSPTSCTYNARALSFSFKSPHYSNTVMAHKYFPSPEAILVHNIFYCLPGYFKFPSTTPVANWKHETSKIHLLLSSKNILLGISYIVKHDNDYYSSPKHSKCSAYFSSDIFEDTLFPTFICPSTEDWIQEQTHIMEVLYHWSIFTLFWHKGTLSYTEFYWTYIVTQAGHELVLLLPSPPEKPELWDDASLSAPPLILS